MAWEAGLLGYQGLTLRFQTRGPERSFEENEWSKTGFLGIIHILFWAPSLKNLGAHSKI